MKALHLCVLASLVGYGCGSQPAGSFDPGAATGELSTAPLGLELQALVVRGELATRATDDGDWQPLSAGTARAGVRELRAMQRGAVVMIGHGDAAGRLWLRAGARVQLGQDERGRVHLAILDGEVRLRRLPSALPVFVGGLPITGDYLLDAGAEHTTVRTETSARPDLAVFSLALDGPELEQGVGRLDAARAGNNVTDPIELARVSVHVHVDGDVATTEIEHVFHSTAGTARPREGTFRFPVPDGAMLTGMAMEIDGKLVEGEIVERDKARQIYDQVVDAMEDPALLEWEQGNWFKLSVFPIAPDADKRVVIRYTTPLVHRPTGWEYDYAVDVAGTGHIGDFSLDVDGVAVTHTTDLATGLDVAVPVATDHVPRVMREARAEATYTAVRITPDAAMMAAGPAGPRRVAIIFDTSRSSLEGRAEQDKVLASTLGELGTGDSVVVLASDVDVTPSTPGFVPATPANAAAAASFLAAIEPDGASDIGSALRATAALHPTDVIYIGDGVPTWGAQEPAELAQAADAIGAPIHAALVGKGATTELWSELAGRSGGRAMIVRTLDDEARFALGARSGEVPRLVNAHVVIAGDATGVSVFPSHAETLFAGDELVAVIRTPAGKAVPAAITLTGLAGGKPVTQHIALAAATSERGVARRWGAQQIAVMEAHDANRDDIVALSRDLGVLSRYTSLLVLENDEAYKQFQIERKQEQLQQQEQQLAAARAPQITGGDLDSLGAQRPSLSPDEVQPGDPEIKIPAPRDARAVTVTFPFGETKRAVWDDDVGAWMVRFLIDKETPDGVYQARVTIEHADGRIEVLALPYTVDTQPPAVELVAKRVAEGYAITARQTDRYKDAATVELQLPDGSQLELTADPLRHGLFTGTWVTDPLASAVTLRIVVRDRALNEAVHELVIQ